MNTLILGVALMVPMLWAALGETVVEGVPSTREVAIDVLRSPDFVSGDYSTSTLADLMVVA